MRNVAEFTMVGRVGRISGESVTRVTIASNYRRKDQDSAWNDDPYWNQVIVFAEGMRRYIAECVSQVDLVFARERIAVNHSTTLKFAHHSGHFFKAKPR